VALLLDALLDLELIRAQVKTAQMSATKSGTDCDHYGEEATFLNEGGVSEVVSMSERNSAQDA
jgi:hypothetical protein